MLTTRPQRRLPDTLLKTIIDIHTRNKISIKFNFKLSKLDKTNRIVCQGCSLSPTLFNLYLDKIITIWQKEDITGIPLAKNKQLFNTIICRRPSHNIQHRRYPTEAAYKLNQIITEYGLTISVQKTKSTAFK
jgi:hypothetical protein